MRVVDLQRLFLLAAIWGASFILAGASLVTGMNFKDLGFGKARAT